MARLGSCPAPLRPRRGQGEVPRRPYSISRTEAPLGVIAVPALVSKELFAQVAEQLAENRRRTRAPSPGRLSAARVGGLPSLWLCLFGQGRAGPGPSYPNGALGVLRLQWPAAGRRGRCPLCRARSVRAQELEAAVWGDICVLLADPARVEQEYQRCAAGEEAEGAAAEGEALAKRVAAVQRDISRLIDSYSEGLLEKEEFEPRLRAAGARGWAVGSGGQAQADAAGAAGGVAARVGEVASGVRGQPSDGVEGSVVDDPPGGNPRRGQAGRDRGRGHAGTRLSGAAGPFC